MVQALAQRLARLGLSNVTCRQADMEALAVRDGSFDAVTCRYGLMYARDAVRALSEAARVVRPAGRIAVMVWAPRRTTASSFTACVRPIRSWRTDAEEGFLAATRFAEPGVLAAMMTSAGLVDAREQELIVEPRIKVGIPFWAPLLEMNATEVWTGLTPDEQKKAHQAVAQAYEPFRDGDH